MSRQRPAKSNQMDPLPLPVAGPEASRATHTPAVAPGKSNTARGSNVKAPTVLGRFGAIELENKGSVARDHLALERTFLAWLRTSLAFASIGIAVTQLFRLNAVVQPPNSTDGPHPLAHMGKSLGATFVGISIIILALGAQRYYESQGWLLKGKFPASRGSIFATALIALLLIIASLAVVLVARPETTEL
ncbi:hypothetical protein EV426DRAFT_584231 [Tirmania nivea]|nr:hypothetical protein EV426DRAFT_584231 [Tirmania nivea]